MHLHQMITVLIFFILLTAFGNSLLLLLHIVEGFHILCFFLCLRTAAHSVCLTLQRGAGNNAMHKYLL